MNAGLNPLLARQLYGGARRSRLFWLLSAHVLLQGLLAWIFFRLSLSSLGTADTTRVSLVTFFNSARQLYWISSLLSLLTTGLLAPVAAIGALAGEVEHRTFDLLRTTTILPRAIVLGKWSAAILIGGLLLLTPLPIQLLGFWLGGISGIELLLTLLFLLIVLMTNTALALALSALVPRTWIAVLIFYGLTLSALPLLGTVAVIGRPVFTSVTTTTLMQTRPLWQLALLQHGWVLLVGLHPLSAAVASVVLGTEQGAWFLLEFPIHASGMRTIAFITLPAPWLTHALLALLATGLLLWWTTRRIARPEV